MMRHYLETKQAYPDCILFYRLGDFYEMFFDDALCVSKELELTLTGKACGLSERAPMCGVPFHAAESYLTKLVSHGHKVAICEQMEDPKTAKGIVKRDVIRIVTPGTNLSIQSLDGSRHNYLMCVFFQPDVTGIAVADVSTGDFLLTEADGIKTIADEIMRYEPSELIANEAFLISGLDTEALKQRHGTAVFPLEGKLFDEDACRRVLCEQFRVKDLSVLGTDSFPAGTIAAGALMQYLFRMQKSDLSNFTRLQPYLQGRYMLLDAATRRNLELTETIRDKSKRGTLLWVLDHTRTAMGARTLRSFIEQPLTDIREMEKRQDAVEALVNDASAREEIREYLKPVYDLERLMARITYQHANPKDLLAFASSLRQIPAVRSVLDGFRGTEALAELSEAMDPLTDLSGLIGQAVSEDAPLSAREGNVIRDGFDETVDRFRAADRDGANWLLALEEETRERTGIKNLRIKYIGNFGYSFEVTNSYRDLVPDDFIRRQTLTNCERFTTPRLKELEDTVLNARERLYAAEYDAFVRVRERIAGEIERIQKTARALAYTDAYASLACAAERNRYVKPQLSTDRVISIRAGRHPVVEQMLAHTDSFIDNDTYLDTNADAIAVITGPNMAGKSTYMRQCALIVLMAQIGSFVPAREARIGICDRVFTRVGASDDLSGGRSTFMVEMSEVAHILRHATPDSLLILDEIGRGTSTCDGLSIAWAVVEYISTYEKLRARTLFATHYHELTELEGTLPCVRNYCSAVREKQDGIVFLHKIIRGGADKSYGIQVAKLAGVPDAVTTRAAQIARKLAENDIARKNTGSLQNGPPSGQWEPAQMSLFEMKREDPLLARLRSVDVNRLTPVDALNILNDMRDELLTRGENEDG
ncbi:MAG: DNA mismatch repair protein MutS [Lachnospiraceae bacterium]|nr:DNA mismatch repair protein MutS [Lachnospiraceae bacterium]